jgi:hypothetical protein
MYCCVYSVRLLMMETPDDGQKTCPKHIEFYSKNKFEKLVLFVGFIIRIFNMKLRSKNSGHVKFKFGLTL